MLWNYMPLVRLYHIIIKPGVIACSTAKKRRDNSSSLSHGIHGGTEGYIHMCVFVVAMCTSFKLSESITSCFR